MREANHVLKEIAHQEVFHRFDFPLFCRLLTERQQEESAQMASATEDDFDKLLREYKDRRL